jgi:hypothetical protein
MRFMIVMCALLVSLSSCKKADDPAPSTQSENTIELKNGYERGPANKEASEAFSLANDFVKHEKDLRRFLITEPSAHGNGEEFEVHYKLFTKSEESEAIVRVDLRTRQCTRIK